MSTTIFCGFQYIIFYEKKLLAVISYFVKLIYIDRIFSINDGKKISQFPYYGLGAFLLCLYNVLLLIPVRGEKFEKMLRDVLDEYSNTVAKMEKLKAQNKSNYILDFV